MEAVKMDIKTVTKVDHDYEQEAVAGPSNQPSSSSSTGAQKPDIFKLDADCLGEIFEYLSVNDLYSFGETCKKMQKIAGEYFRQNYAATAHSASSMEGFNRFKTQLSIYGKGSVRYIKTCSKEFESVNYIRLASVQLKKYEVNCLKKLLSKVVTLEMVDCFMEDDFHTLLKWCKNLKRLFIRNSILGADYVPLDSDGYDSEKYDSDAEQAQNNYLWLLQTYPHLEYLYLHTDNDYFPQLSEFNGFFDRHPNIRTLSADYRFILRNHAELLNSRATIDTLKLFVINDKKYNGWNLLWNTIEQLYTQGFYKRLHLGVHGFNQQLIDRIATLQGVEKFTTFALHNIKSIKWCPFPNVTELVTVCSMFSHHFADDVNTEFELLANIFENVERLYLEYVTTEQILPFIRRFRKLNKMKVHFKPILYQQNAPRPNFGRNKKVKIENKVKPTVLNLQQLNNERKQLAGARKIIIYVQDDVFLATKWATHNGDTDLSLIEMRRAESYEWDRLQF